MKSTVKSSLQDLLIKSGMDLQQIAKASNLQSTTIDRILKGSTEKPSKTTIKAISDALNVNFDYLYYGKGDAESNHNSENNLLERALAKLEAQLDKKDALIDKLTAILMNQNGSKNFLQALNMTGLNKKRSLGAAA